ncbi:hypothetical protein [Legionella sp.]|uniref:hypothetical protein n=1 Tax=Legionella sp. TaxID=459 RepID=UPI0039E31EE4
MKRKYFGLDEISNFFKQKDMIFGFYQLRYCVLEGIIHPLIYIDSRPVYAAKTRGKEAVAIGFCYLSAYLDMGDEIIVTLDKISNSQSVQIESHINKDQLSSVKTFGWRIDSHFFDEVPTGYIDLQPFPGIDAIKFFFCLQKNPIYLQVKI